MYLLIVLVRGVYYTLHNFKFNINKNQQEKWCMFSLWKQNEYLVEKEQSDKALSCKTVIDTEIVSEDVRRKHAQPIKPKQRSQNKFKQNVFTSICP